MLSLPTTSKLVPFLYTLLCSATYNASDTEKVVDSSNWTPGGTRRRFSFHVISKSIARGGVSRSAKSEWADGVPSLRTSSTRPNFWSMSRRKPQRPTEYGSLEMFDMDNSRTSVNRDSRFRSISVVGSTILKLIGRGVSSSVSSCGVSTGSSSISTTSKRCTLMSPTGNVMSCELNERTRLDSFSKALQTTWSMHNGSHASRHSIT
mmetsp:Transcript_136056/g.435192  ORF Transcript_136056/g.435192 Transcript_136056/m.435192 type:complete len:206 (-) Transcript_136056:831-1448(-)